MLKGQPEEPVRGAREPEPRGRTRGARRSTGGSAGAPVVENGHEPGGCSASILRCACEARGREGSEDQQAGRGREYNIPAME